MDSRAEQHFILIRTVECNSTALEKYIKDVAQGNRSQGKGRQHASSALQAVKAAFC